MLMVDKVSNAAHNITAQCLKCTSIHGLVHHFIKASRRLQHLLLCNVHPLDILDLLSNKDTRAEATAAADVWKKICWAVAWPDIHTLDMFG